VSLAAGGGLDSLETVMVGDWESGEYIEGPGDGENDPLSGEFWTGGYVVSHS
jgi:hypothetical protein